MHEFNRLLFDLELLLRSQARELGSVGMLVLTGERSGTISCVRHHSAPIEPTGGYGVRPPATLRDFRARARGGTGATTPQARNAFSVSGFRRVARFSTQPSAAPYSLWGLLVSLIKTMAGRRFCPPGRYMGAPDGSGSG